MVIVKYICSICKGEYETEKEAKACESQFPNKSYYYKIGEIYELSYDCDFDYGILIGESINKHIKGPMIFMFNEEGYDWKITNSTDGWYKEVKGNAAIRKRAREMLKLLMFDKDLIKESEL